MYNYDNWDSSETEKCHTQFLKRIMGCDIHSPNLMIRAEFGINPLLTDIICRSISFLKHIVINNTSLSYQSFSYELYNTDDNNLLRLIRLYKPDIINSTEKISKYKINKECKENYQLIWDSKIKELPKAISYNFFKSSSNLEKYITVITNRKHKIALGRLRVSSHSLMIEKGRHSRPKIEREERYCPYCVNLVEDECHFITNCPLYNVSRTELVQEIRKTCLYYHEMTDIQKFIFVMTNENTSIIKKLAKFVFISMEKRKEFLNSDTS